MKNGLNGCTFFFCKSWCLLCCKERVKKKWVWGRINGGCVETRCFFAVAISFGLSAQADSCNEENFIYYVWTTHDYKVEHMITMRCHHDDVWSEILRFIEKTDYAFVSKNKPIFLIPLVFKWCKLEKLRQNNHIKWFNLEIPFTHCATTLCDSVSIILGR